VSRRGRADGGVRSTVGAAARSEWPLTCGLASPCRFDLQLDFLEAVSGCSKEINIDRLAACTVRARSTMHTHTGSAHTLTLLPRPPGFRLPSADLRRLRGQERHGAQHLPAVQRLGAEHAGRPHPARGLQPDLHLPALRRHGASVRALREVRRQRARPGIQADLAQGPPW
jgi:hypothetical protein